MEFCETRPIRILGARTHNLKNVSRRDPAGEAHRDHGRLGLRQVVARVRHALRGRAAALRGIDVHVRAPVPREARPSGRRFDRAGPAGRSRSSSETASRTPARPSERRRRSPIRCGCSSPTAARRSVPTTARRLAAGASISRSIARGAARAVARDARRARRASRRRRPRDARATWPSSRGAGFFRALDSENAAVEIPSDPKALSALLGADGTPSGARGAIRRVAGGAGRRWRRPSPPRSGSPASCGR